MCSENLTVVGCVTVVELSLHIFLGNFRVTVISSKYFEKNITMTLSEETPRWMFSKICSNFGTAISQNSSERLHTRKLYLFS